MDQHQEIHIEFINATELKPEAKYILVASQAQVDELQLTKIIGALNEMGIKNAVGVHVPGDPETAIRIIKQESK